MSSIVELCEEWLSAKAVEDQATATRVAVEQKIIKGLGCPEEGTQTNEADVYKIKIDQRIIRKIDPKAWSLVVDQIPEALRPVSIKETYAIDNKGVRWLKENEPGYYLLLCMAMEEKPAKPSVKVEVNQ